MIYANLVCRFIVSSPYLQAVECKKYASSVKIIAMTENVDIKNKQGLTPLHIAAINNDVAIAHKLLDKGAYVDECDNVRFILASFPLFSFLSSLSLIC